MSTTATILACFIFNDNLKTKDFGLTKEFFKSTNERLVFKELNGNRAIPVLNEKLKGKIEPSYLSGIMDGVPHNPTMEYVAGLIREVKRERLKIDLLKKIGEEGKSGFFDFDSSWEIYRKIEDLEFEKDQIEVISAENIKLKAVKYDWPLRIPTNKFTLITGKPSRYKSGLLAYLAACYTTGKDWPFAKNNIKGSVLILSHEDDVEDTLGPRLKVAGCDMSKIKILTEQFNLNFDLPKIKRIAAKITDLCSIFIDPINKYSGTIHLDKMESINPLFFKLMDFSKTLPITIIGVHHNRKDDKGDPMDLILGSRAWSASPRVIHALEYDNDKVTMLFLPVKNNLAPPQKTISFKIKEKVLDDIGDTVPYCADFQISEKTPEEIMNKDPETSDRRYAFDECKDIILETLNENHLSADDFRESVTKAGISDSTFEKTRAALKAKGIIKSNKNMGCWFWDLKR